MPVARVDNVTRDYIVGEFTTRALRGVSLEVDEGEFLTLVGPSGSGKTTLLQLMGCLDQPTSGSVWLDGREVSRLSRDERAEIRQNAIGFIFQFYALIPTLSAYENVEMPLLLTGIGAGERHARVMHLLEAVGLADRSQHRPDQLSGGEQQRTAVARALVKRPRIVLADEPTANLDTANGQQIMEMMLRLNEETGVTFIFATHDPRVIRYARRVITLRDGLVVANGAVPPPAEEQ
ncbi:MAG: ABC transporter ATP-binding protein [Anaerolineae bacterium]|jgi:putative ABC transport system ATP-binding protein